MSLRDDIQAAINAMDVVAQDLDNEQASVGDQVLEAIQPVLVAAGWTAPAPAETTTPVEIPVTE